MVSTCDCPYSEAIWSLTQQSNDRRKAIDLIRNPRPPPEEKQLPHLLSDNERGYVVLPSARPRVESLEDWEEELLSDSDDSQTSDAGPSLPLGNDKGQGRWQGGGLGALQDGAEGSDSAERVTTDEARVMSVCGVSHYVARRALLLTNGQLDDAAQLLIGSDTAMALAQEEQELTFKASARTPRSEQKAEREEPKRATDLSALASASASTGGNLSAVLALDSDEEQLLQLLHGHNALIRLLCLIRLKLRSLHSTCIVCEAPLPAPLPTELLGHDSHSLSTGSHTPATYTRPPLRFTACFSPVCQTLFTDIFARGQQSAPSPPQPPASSPLQPPKPSPSQSATFTLAVAPTNPTSTVVASPLRLLSTQQSVSSSSTWCFGLSSMLISSPLAVDLSLTLFSYAVELYRLRSYHDTPFSVSAESPELGFISFASSSVWVDHSRLASCIRSVPSVWVMKDWAQSQPRLLQEKLDAIDLLMGPLLHWLMLEGPVQLRQLQGEQRLPSLGVGAQFALLDDAVDFSQLVPSSFRFFLAPAASWHSVLREGIPAWIRRQEDPGQIHPFNCYSCSFTGTALPDSMWLRSTLPAHCTLVGLAELQGKEPAADRKTEPVLRYLLLSHGLNPLPDWDLNSIAQQVLRRDYGLHGRLPRGTEVDYTKEE